MTDLLVIENLELWTHLGVPKEERTKEQRVRVTVELHLDLSKAAKTDDVNHSIDYAKLAADLKQLSQTERKTLERFAADCADLILKKYRPEAVTITATKFALPGSSGTSVTMTKEKKT
jgi:FolB domain-containing protein